MQVQLRGLGPPHKKQQQILTELLTPSKDVKLVDACCGRAFGKTDTSVMAALAVMIRYPGISGEFLEPDWSRINKVFLKKWRKIVPAELYDEVKIERKIVLKNGSVLYYRPRNVTGNQEAAADAGRGPDLSFIIDDEAALACSQTAYNNNLASLREQSPCRFYFTISSFRYGDYELLLDNPSHKVFYASTSDNPYLAPGFEALLRSQMPPEVAMMELDSKRGTPADAIWNNFIWEPWPRGNILEGHVFDPREPWWLACDLGNHGSYQIYQCPKAVDPVTGATVLEGRLWCMVEEILSNSDGGLKGAINVIRSIVGDVPPQMVYCGHDANTKEAIRGSSANHVFSAMRWPYKFPGGHLRFKEIQRTHMVHMIHEKRFVVAATRAHNNAWTTVQHLGEGKKRGILEVLRRDKHPDVRGIVFDKDKSSSNPKTSIEDDRDAMLYGAIGWRHPSTYGIETIIQ